MISEGWTDRPRTAWGFRMPFLVIATVVAVAALALMPTAAGSRNAVAVVPAIFFFVAYYFAYHAPG